MRLLLWLFAPRWFWSLFSGFGFFSLPPKQWACSVWLYDLINCIKRLIQFHGFYNMKEGTIMQELTETWSEINSLVMAAAWEYWED